jgi:hypothetical protein
MKGTHMTDKIETELKRVVFQVPRPLLVAAQVAASRDMTTLSYVCRKALAREMKERGLLPETVAG